MFIAANWPVPAAQAGAVQTTRYGGYSLPPYASLNLGDHVGDAIAHVQHNRKLVQTQLNLALPLQTVHQVHGHQVIRLDQPVGTTHKPEADALYTRVRQLPLCMLTADCLPIFLIDRYGHEIAIIHGGWRSLAQGIIAHTLACFDSAPKDMLVYMGAAIGAKQFVVGEEVRQVFTAQNTALGLAFTAQHDTATAHTVSKYFADIYAIATMMLHAQGITQIYRHDYCTLSDADLFFSYRREQTTGRMGSIIWLP